MIDLIADDTPELQAWRAEVREFLEAELPGGMHFDYDFSEDPAKWDAYLAFWRKVGQKGWVALTWSKDCYGLERSPTEYWIMMEEFTNYAVPMYPIIGPAVARALLKHGTPEQRKRHLKGIAEATCLWGEGFTEPQAGSDLASLTTRAHLDGDHWVINGQKTLGTAAHRADWMFVLARTDPDATRHRGISAFLVPLDSLVGAAGDAWNQVWFGLGGDRNDRAGPAPDPWFGRAQRTFNLLKRFVQETERDGKPLSEDPVVRLQMAELEMGIETVRLHSAEAHSNFKNRQMRVGSPVFVSHLHHGFYKEFFPRLCQTAMEIVGPTSQIQGGPWAHMQGHIELAFRASFGLHAGGTSQLKRMTMATRGLGLPR
jgi:alkylation response protein AidB-like acyl-CoA dehydrogenase